MTDKELARQTDTNTNAISLIQKDLSYMTKGIDEIKDSMKELKDSVINGFVSKQDFDNLRARVKTIESNNNWVIKIILGAIIVALLSLIGLRMK